MNFKPQVIYDPESKIWSCQDEHDHFESDLSMGEIIFKEMRRHPKQIAQISTTQNTVLTREELLLNSMRVASYLRQLGLLQTDIVGIVARNTTHISAVAYGCFFNGIAFHSVSMLHETETIEKLFNNTKPRIVFCDGDDYEKIRGATQKLDVTIVTMRNHPTGSVRIDEVLQTHVEDNFKPTRLARANDQTMAILCSSGTTGSPKAVTISNSRKILNGCLSLTTADVQYAPSTLDWISGLTTTITSAVFSTKRIIADTPFDPDVALRLIDEHKITWVLLAPAHVALTVSCPTFERASLVSLMSFGFTGGRCSLDAQHRLRQRLQRDILQFGYGLTEVGTRATLSFNFDEKPNSVGRLTNGFRLKILNEQNEPLGPLDIGEVYLHNGQYWAGYYGNPEETRSIRDSQLWYHTGDLGYMDKDGFLFIVDRKKDLLKYQSMKYFPNEIEAVIAQMPQVADVCVFGAWNQFNGDEAVAAVVAKPGAQLKPIDVVHYVKKHVLEKHKHLNGGAIIVDDLKCSANGKTNRAANKAHFMALKGLREI